jgi:RNA recognition motif-containing protein
MPGKIFVGNLSYNVSDADLSELIAGLNIATASVKIMRDMDTGRSRGFGFVELTPEGNLEAAIEALNGKVLDGRALTANEARPQKRREFGGGGGQGFNRNRGKFGSGGGGGRGRGPRERERDRPKRKIQELY